MKNNQNVLEKVNMSKDLIEQLKSAKDNGRLAVDLVWVKQNKGYLLNKIQVDKVDKTEKENISSEVFGWNVMNSGRGLVFGRSALTISLAIVISIAGWIASVSASYNSLPGDVLYNIKIATEKTQLVVGNLVGGSERKAELLNDAAKTRAYETKALVNQNKLDKVDKSLKSLQNSVDQAQKSLADIGENKPAKAASAASDLNKATKVIVDTLDEAVEDIDDKELSDKIVDARREVSAKGMDAVESIVDLAQEKKDKGETEVSDEDVSKLVKDAIDNLKSDVEKNSAATEELKKVLGDEKSEGINISASTSTLIVSSTLIASSTLPAVSGSGSAQSVGTVGVKEITAVNEAAKEGLSEAIKMAEGGQLKEAINKARDISTDVNTLSKGIMQVVVEEKNRQEQSITDQNNFVGGESSITMQSSTLPAVTGSSTGLMINKN